MVICAVMNCRNRSGRSSGISYFCFPNVIDNKGTKINQCSINRRKVWLSRINRADLSEDNLKHKKVCSEHFVQGKPSDLLDVTHPDWAPSLKLGHKKFKENSLQANDRYRRNIEHISCCISGCQSKSPRKIEYNPEIEEENILMFPVPRTGKLFNQWKEALKGTETELTWDDHICEHHFLENDIERYHRTKTQSGDIIEIQKKLPTLKPDAVPIKFLKTSPYLITKDPSKKQQSASQKSFVVNYERNLRDNSNLILNSCNSDDCAVDNEIEMCYNSSIDTGSLVNLADSFVKSEPVQISHKPKYLLYSELLKSIQLVKKPSKFWSVVCSDEFTIFARWNKEFIAEKRLVIESPFSIRVFLKDWEIEMTDLVDVTSVDDVSLLLEKVENYNMDFQAKP